jgi:hypothetical protein
VESNTENVEFFLGGQDLEMLTIRDLLEERNIARVHDRKLVWGEARASVYLQDIAACREAGRLAVLVELVDDCDLAEAVDAGEVILVDHHGDRAGKDLPTALEQVFRFLAIPDDLWTREFELVAANDRGHVRGMLAVAATPAELQRIRAADRAAQAITPVEEKAGRAAAEERQQYLEGRLSVVHLPHARSATVTDVLETALGGPGYENLLIVSPAQTLFYGCGRAIELLKSQFPGGWWGGELPERGFWGVSRTLDEQNAILLLMSDMTTKPANTIEVKGFRHIVMLPLLLRRASKPQLDDKGLLQPWVKEFTGQGPWEEECSRLPGGVHSRFQYEQIVYFHPFVRDFLFGDGSTDNENRTTRILTRSDIGGLRVEMRSESELVRLCFDVRRVELYLCKPCVAILVVEVENPRHEDEAEKPVMLSELQDFTDQFRRLYPPFWWDSDSPEPKSAGLCLSDLKWLTPAPSAEPIALEPWLPPKNNSDDAASRKLGSAKRHFESFTRVGAEPPLFSHWQWFFGKTIRPVQSQEHIHGDIPGLFIQQLLDERMPVMSYFSVDDPSEVTQGDHDRLTFVDAAGTDRFPYQEKFLSDRRMRHTYDRFAHYGTRYFCSGYGFSMIGPAGDYHYGTLLPDHFSGHYFCLGLIAHFQRAALLYFSDELASSVKDLAGKSLGDELSSPKFRERLETIQHRFLKFRSRAFFPEVTNQLQGRELYQLWFDVLETQKLFELVDSTSERMATVLAERESRQLTRVATLSIPWGIGLATAAAGFSVKDIVSPWWVVICSLIVVGITHCLLVGIKAKPWWNRLRQYPKQIWSRIAGMRSHP